MLRAASSSFETIVLAPLAPFGLHHALGGTPQNNVVTTMRLSEVAADPTSALALEVAARRVQRQHDGQPAGQDRLAAVQRITRAQHFAGPRSFAHFAVLALVHAGRDQGNYGFEVHATMGMLDTMIDAVRSTTAAPIHIRLTAFSRELAASCSDMQAELSSADVTCDLWPERTAGRGYYSNIGFKLDVENETGRVEVGDGGDVGWTQELVQNRKERLVTGGLSIDRLAMFIDDMQAAE